MPRITLALATMLSFVAFTPVAAQDYQNGYDAALAVDYATALKEWRPLAEQGDANAQTSLGTIYNLGHDVLQENIMAYMWYNLGAANRYRIAGESWI